VLTLTSDSPIIKIFPDKNICALSVSFISLSVSTTYTYQVDDGQFLYLTQADDPAVTRGSATRAKLITAFLSFPRGSRTISIRGESELGFELNSGTNFMAFVGAQQYVTRPPIEKLTLSQAIIKCFNIAPKQLFKTSYGDSGAAFYTPGANDNIDSIALTGTWTHSGSVDFNGNTANSSTLNDTFDVSFTLQNDSGGISFNVTVGSATRPREIEFYLIDGGAASETNSLIQVINLQWADNYFSNTPFKLLGLNSGPYTIRMKHKDSGRALAVSGVNVYDGTEPDPNSNTVTDIANNLQSVIEPEHVEKIAITLDSIDRVPVSLNRTGYKEGISTFDYSLNANGFSDDSESTQLNLKQLYFGHQGGFNSANDFVRKFAFCKSYASYDTSTTGRSLTVQPVIDGRNSANTYSQRVQTKAGSSPASTSQGTSTLFAKNFFLLASGNMSNSTTFLMGDTRGLIVKQKVVVKANGETTQIRTIASISADVNVIFTKPITAFANFTTANSTSIFYGGFHTLKLNQDDAANQMFLSSLLFEPLDVMESDFCKRIGTKTKVETVSKTFNAVVNGDDLFYPSHSAGVPGNTRTSSTAVIGTSSTAQTYDFPENLKDVVVSTGNIDVKITSTREVPVE